MDMPIRGKLEARCRRRILWRNRQLRLLTYCQLAGRRQYADIYFRKIPGIGSHLELWSNQDRGQPGPAFAYQGRLPVGLHDYVAYGWNHCSARRRDLSASVSGHGQLPAFEKELLRSGRGRLYEWTRFRAWIQTHRPALRTHIPGLFPSIKSIAILLAAPEIQKPALRQHFCVTVILVAESLTVGVTVGLRQRECATMLNGSERGMRLGAVGVKRQRPVEWPP